MKSAFFSIIVISAFLLSAFQNKEVEDGKYVAQLSEYGFFEGKISNQNPAKDVFLYELNSPLFSDYAEKLRFIRLPNGGKIAYNNEQVFDFPNGTAIIKTFYYTKDGRKPEKGRILVETRVLLKDKDEWTTLPYVWNDEQTDAKLSVIGGKKDIEWRDEKGNKRSVKYSIPNKNQCKGCHNYDNKIRPIGPSARQINGNIKQGEGVKNQLALWNEKGIIDGLPDRQAIPQMVDYRHETSGSLDDRARAYLDANCGHCHNPKGPANTSGLFLNRHEKSDAALGINKAPIAAGRGSGGRKYGIVPGKPNESILLFRMKENDPGIRMPEIGRQLEHDEGIKLVEEWIKSL